MLTFNFKLKMTTEAHRDNPIAFAKAYLNSYGLTPSIIEVERAGIDGDDFVMNLVTVLFKIGFEKL